MQVKNIKNMQSCGRNMWFGEYASAEWTGAKKRSRHLVLWSRNHKYGSLTWKDRSSYQSISSEFRYDFGKVLGTQNRPTRGSASIHYILCLNLIKGMFNIAFYTHTHTNMHLTINMASNIPKPNIHLSCSSTKPSIHLSYISTITNPNMFLSKASHLIWHHIMVKVEHRHGIKHAYIISKATNKSWNNQTNMLLHLTIEGKRQTNNPHPCLSSKQVHIQVNACSCECMYYLVYLSASQHLCIDGWTCECMIMASKQEIKETLI